VLDLSLFASDDAQMVLPLVELSGLTIARTDASPPSCRLLSAT
jgi:hypothetical protein